MIARIDPASAPKSAADVKLAIDGHDNIHFFDLETGATIA